MLVDVFTATGVQSVPVSLCRNISRCLVSGGTNGAAWVLLLALALSLIIRLCWHISCLGLLFRLFPCHEVTSYFACPD